MNISKRLSFLYELHEIMFTETNTVDENNNTCMILTDFHSHCDSLMTLMVESEKHNRPQNYDKLVDNYSEEDFFHMFRMCKNTFNILLSLLKQNPSFTTAWSNGIQPISPAQKALVTLFYLSSQQTVRQIGDKFNIADSSVIKSRNDFLKSISTLRNKLIKWPTTEEEQCIVSQQFESLANFKGIIGAIDGTHIEGLFPKDVQRSYCNRKSRYTMILQGTCTAKKIFTNISIGCPGRMHDSRVLNNSQLQQKIEIEGTQSLFCNNDFHILGDSAYPLKSWLMTPYKKTRGLTNSETRFNKAHSKSRFSDLNF